MNDDIYDQLELAMSEAENARREAFKESMRRRKAEKEAMEAIRKVGFQNITLQSSHSALFIMSVGDLMAWDLAGKIG